jgi:hypothetical protein
MLNQNPKPERKRVLAGNQVNLSPWHYGAQTKERQVNVVQEVNKVGSHYALNPNGPDATKLIEYFHGYIMKYVELLTRGIIAKQGHRIPSDTRKFLGLFRPKESANIRPLAAKEMQTIAERIPNAFISMTADDIYNELVVLFLELASKFDSSIGGFTGYIGCHFKYALKQRMFQVQRDALNYLNFFEELLDTEELDEDIDSDPDHDFGDPETTLKLFDTIGLSKLNHSFVSTPPLLLEKKLSKLQRKIIVMSCCENLSMNQIAQKLNINDSSKIKKDFDLAIQILRDIAGIDLIQGDECNTI